MKIINFGGIGGCRISDILNRTGYRKEAYPFDWNFTNQYFPINLIKTNGEKFFVFEDQYVITEKHLISPCNNACICHDFNGNWNIRKIQVKEKYTRRLNRLLNLINSEENICFCREVIEEVGYRDHADIICDMPTFDVVADSISIWEDFMNYIESIRSAKTKLVLFTVNQNLSTSRKNIEIIKWDRKIGIEQIMIDKFKQINTKD